MEKFTLLAGYPYLYETHLHTSRGSACAICSPVEAAKAYHEAGYSGIIITEHNWGGNTAVPRYLAWPEWVEQFTRGYHEARRWGDSHGLSVFWGYEAGFDGTEFLVLGLEPEFLLKYPQIKRAGVAEQYRIVKEAGGFVVHAHPYRSAYYIPEIRLFPQYVDAVEGINATHHNRFMQDNYGYFRSDEIFNSQAVEYANKYNLPMTAGSDAHSTRLYGAGMAFERRPMDAKDMLGRISSKEGYVLTDGLMWYDPTGRQIAEVDY